LKYLFLKSMSQQKAYLSTTWIWMSTVNVCPKLQGSRGD